jgi:hypothetical protein
VDPVDDRLGVARRLHCEDVVPLVLDESGLVRPQTSGRGRDRRRPQTESRRCPNPPCKAYTRTPAGSLLGRNGLTRADRDVPQVSVRVGEGAAVAPPLLSTGLDDRAAGGVDLGQDLIDPVVRGNDV